MAQKLTTNGICDCAIMARSFQKGEKVVLRLRERYRELLDKYNKLSEEHLKLKKKYKKDSAELREWRKFDREIARIERETDEYIKNMMNSDL